MVRLHVTTVLQTEAQHLQELLALHQQDLQVLREAQERHQGPTLLQAEAALRVGLHVRRLHVLRVLQEVAPHQGPILHRVEAAHLQELPARQEAAVLQGTQEHHQGPTLLQVEAALRVGLHARRLHVRQVLREVAPHQGHILHRAEAAHLQELPVRQEVAVLQGAIHRRAEVVLRPGRIPHLPGQVHQVHPGVQGLQAAVRPHQEEDK